MWHAHSCSDSWHIAPVTSVLGAPWTSPGLPAAESLVTSRMNRLSKPRSEEVSCWWVTSLVTSRMSSKLRSERVSCFSAAINTPSRALARAILVSRSKANSVLCEVPLCDQKKKKMSAMAGRNYPKPVPGLAFCCSKGLLPGYYKGPLFRRSDILRSSIPKQIMDWCFQKINLYNVGISYVLLLWVMRKLNVSLLVVSYFYLVYINIGPYTTICFWSRVSVLEKTCLSW